MDLTETERRVIQCLIDLEIEGLEDSDDKEAETTDFGIFSSCEEYLEFLHTLHVKME